MCLVTFLCCQYVPTLRTLFCYLCGDGACSESRPQNPLSSKEEVTEQQSLTGMSGWLMGWLATQQLVG